MRVSVYMRGCQCVFSSVYVCLCVSVLCRVCRVCVSLSLCAHVFIFSRTVVVKTFVSVPKVLMRARTYWLFVCTTSVKVCIPKIVVLSPSLIALPQKKGLCINTD